MVSQERPDPRKDVLSTDILQYRKQVLSFLRYLREREATLFFSSESSAELPDDEPKGTVRR